jgi:PAS domain S-box-containing protein
MPKIKDSRLDIQALFESYPHFEQILHNIKQVLWVTDLENDQILYISPAFDIVWGRSRERYYAAPSSFINCVHPEDRIKVLSANPVERGESLDQSYRILRPDGEVRWISAHTFVIQDESSGAAYRICVAQDITQQNQVDQALRRALDRSREQFTLSRRMSLARKPDVVLKTLMSASELRAAKSGFVLFFESQVDGPSHGFDVITSWASGSYLPNPDPAEFSKETTLIEDLAILDLFHPSKPVIVSDISKDQRLTLAVRDLLLEMQIRTVAIFPLVTLGNWLGCLLLLFTKERHFEPADMQHIKVLVDQAAITLHNLQLLKTEAESRHEAERANEIKTEFLAMISHELRTPLTSIIGFTTTLLADDVTWEAAEQQDFIRTIQQEANRLEELINHLLAVSRLEAGVLPIHLEVPSMDQIIADALPQLQTLTNGHTLNLHLPAALPPVYVDGKRIAQVLVNLVRNAATYAPAGTEISVSASVRGNFVQMNVIDLGPGIPTSEHKRVFKAFHRGENVESASPKGAGLGLAICKGLIEAHAGRIWIKKKTTRGASISFTIPLAPSQVQTSVTQEEQ